MVVVGATVRLYHLGQNMIRTRMSYLAGGKEIRITPLLVEVQKCKRYLFSFERLFTGG